MLKNSSKWSNKNYSKFVIIIRTQIVRMKFSIVQRTVLDNKNCQKLLKKSMVVAPLVPIQPFASGIWFHDGILATAAFWCEHGGKVLPAVWLTIFGVKGCSIEGLKALVATEVLRMPCFLHSRCARLKKKFVSDKCHGTLPRHPKRIDTLSAFFYVRNARLLGNCVGSNSDTLGDDN